VELLLDPDSQRYEINVPVTELRRLVRFLSFRYNYRSAENCAENIQHVLFPTKTIKALSNINWNIGPFRFNGKH
jgi:hypothetical protein